MQLIDQLKSNIRTKQTFFEICIKYNDIEYKKCKKKQLL